MRTLSAALLVFAAAVLIATEVATAHLHPDRWGLLFGIPLGIIGLAGWFIAFVRDGRATPPMA